jgi:DNA helicase HerA-like ATPase
VAQSCRYILQSRKFGIGFIFVSQRTAVISKSALSQCESYIIFRSLDDTSLQYIEGVVGSEFRGVASGLNRYQAICVGPAFNTTVPVVVDLDP